MVANDEAVNAQSCVSGVCFGSDTMWLADSFSGIAGSSSETGTAEF